MVQLVMVAQQEKIMSLQAPTPQLKLQATSEHSKELIQKAIDDPNTLQEQREYLLDLLKRKY